MRYLLIFIFVTTLIFSSNAQTDTLKKISEDTTITKIKPAKNPILAISLSAAIPGAGQIYNGKFLKVPFIYAVLGGVGYFVRKYHWQYTAYRNDIILMDDENIPESLKFPTTGIYNLDELKTNYNSARRQRDLIFLGGVLFWTLNIIDAYVDAELSNFDVSDDLSFNIYPKYHSFNNNPYYGLAFQLKF